MKKKKIIVINISAFIVGILSIVTYNLSLDKEVIMSNLITKKDDTDMISLLIETDFKTGKYKEATSYAWPGEGYVLNEALSKCENDSKITYNKDTDKVEVLANGSDRCYVYFDLGEKNFKAYLISTVNSDDSLLYHNSSLVNGANDNSYRYSGANYSIASKYSSEFDKLYVNKSVQELGNGVIERNYLEGIGIKYYMSYDHNKYFATYDEALEQGTKDGYISAINNYVCFGSDEDTCPDANLYRIIGIFDEGIKLVKNTFANYRELGSDGEKAQYQSENDYCPIDDAYDEEYTREVCIDSYLDTYASMAWNYNNSTAATNATGYSNVWSYSDLNKINLNTNFLNTFSSTWQEMIKENMWKVGGSCESLLGEKAITGKYDLEFCKGMTKPTFYPDDYKAKIGLIYFADYLYTVSPSMWETSFNNTTITTSTSWIADFTYGHTVWTLTRLAFSTANIVYTANYSTRNVSNKASVLPSFYLDSNKVKVSGGIGTKLNPYRLSV